MARLLRAGRIMVTRLVTVAPEVDVLEGLRLLRRHRITGMPVVRDGDEYLGTLTEKGCISALLAAWDAGAPSHPLPAREIMIERPLALHVDDDAFRAVERLLRHRYSGAPVVDDEGRFLGVFSERYIMRLVVASAYEQLPSPRVGAYLNTDRGRLVEETADIRDIARMLRDSYYRRLPVVRGDVLVGQISRRDVLAARHALAETIASRHGSLAASWPGAATSGRTWTVADFMDRDAPTTSEATDGLAIAQLFLDSNRRRLPVLREGRLVGQISRRDLLAEVLRTMRIEPDRGRPGLYVSAVRSPEENPALRSR